MVGLLKSEIAVGGSPRALTVLPVRGSDGRKTESVGMKSSEPVTSARAVACLGRDCEPTEKLTLFTESI